MIPGTADRVLNFIQGQQSELISLLRHMVDAESPSNRPQSHRLIISVLTDALASLGFKVRVPHASNAHKHFEGFLTSAKNVSVTRPTLPAATDIQLRVHRRGKFRKPTGGLFKCEFEASLDGTVVARGELSSYVQPVMSTSEQSG